MEESTQKQSPTILTAIDIPCLCLCSHLNLQNTTQCNKDCEDETLDDRKVWNLAWTKKKTDNIKVEPKSMDNKQRQRQTQTQRQRQGQWQRLVQSKDHFFPSALSELTLVRTIRINTPSSYLFTFSTFKSYFFFHSQLPGMKTERTPGRSEQTGITSGF